MEQTHPLPHVVIIGGGFAGLECARRLKKARCRITMFDARNHHLFRPLLYQVATAGLAALYVPMGGHPPMMMETPMGTSAVSLGPLRPTP